MFSEPISIKVIFALALAALMAWGGHASALPAWAGNDAAHAHGDGASACAACADHSSSLTADHLHETPHPTTLLSIISLPERAQPIEAPRYSMPPGPLFLIERPPRATFVL
ncbi:hypothetical protein [Pseudomonas sp.]|uniref:hypothetical protein n=1 Tax=Pseudomonas sp. TaxID=306 RepID=UPI00260E35B2|nr:hypothetical protein [Pseudomonas sp.]